MTLASDFQQRISELNSYILKVEGKAPEAKAQFELLKNTVTLSETDRKRVTELTDFYVHLSDVVEKLIEKFSL